VRRPAGRTDIGLTYPILFREVEKRAIRCFLTDGPGGPLVFSWAVGAAVFLGVLAFPVLILPLSVSAAVIGWRMLTEYTRDPAVRARLVRSVIQERCPPPNVTDAAFHSCLRNGQNLFIEVTLKVMGGRTADRDATREDLVAQACEMLGTLYESGRQAQEFQRVLEIVGQTQVAPDVGAELAFVHHSSGLLRANAATLREGVARASNLATEIVDQLQTLLLQVTQLGVQAIDLVRGAAFAREARQAIEQIQMEVSTRQAVAQQVIADLAGPSETTRLQPTAIEKGL
jgi:hypothetical protein